RALLPASRPCRGRAPHAPAHRRLSRSAPRSLPAPCRRSPPRPARILDAVAVSRLDRIVIDEEGRDLEPVFVMDGDRLVRAGPRHVMTDQQRGLGCVATSPRSPIWSEWTCVSSTVSILAPGMLAAAS